MNDQQTPCAQCGQISAGQTGEYPCSRCGVPRLHDAPSAPRVTPQDIEANIRSEHYFTAKQGALAAEADALGWERVVASVNVPENLGLLTFCVLVLENGFTVTGESACVSPENFDAGLGRQIARENAVQKIWPLMGYALKQHLHEGRA